METIWLEPEITVQKHQDVFNSLALVDYDHHTIFLGNNICSDDVEEYIEDTLTHEYMHFVLFKHFGVEAAMMYERIYGEVEPRGRVHVCDLMIKDDEDWVWSE